MDRDRDGVLSWDEFFLGACASDPATVHILNSFTGYERARFIFDFYDINRSGALEFAEFDRLTKDGGGVQQVGSCSLHAMMESVPPQQWDARNDGEQVGCSLHAPTAVRGRAAMMESRRRGVQQCWRADEGLEVNGGSLRKNDFSPAFFSNRCCFCGWGSGCGEWVCGEVCH